MGGGGLELSSLVACAPIAHTALPRSFLRRQEPAHMTELRSTSDFRQRSNITWTAHRDVEVRTDAEDRLDSCLCRNDGSVNRP